MVETVCIIAAIGIPCTDIPCRGLPFWTEGRKVLKMS